MKQAAAFAVGFHEPNVVVLEIVFFGFDGAADGINDAAVGSEAEGGDFVVDILERLVEILRASSAIQKEQVKKKNSNTEASWKTSRLGLENEDASFLVDGPRRGWRRGCGPVKSEQHGFSDGLEFHEFDASVVGIVEIELPFAVAADFGLLRRASRRL